MLTKILCTIINYIYIPPIFIKLDVQGQFYLRFPWVHFDSTHTTHRYFLWTQYIVGKFELNNTQNTSMILLK